VDAKSGKILWDFDGWTVNTANVPSPVDCGNGRVFVSGGYNSGAMMLQMNGSATGVSSLFRLSANTFQSHQHTPILYNGHLYGIKVGGALMCLDLKGNVVWSSAGKAQYGLGPYTLADGMLYVLSEKGLLALVEATPSGYKELSKAQVLSGGDAWAPLALADGKLIARDLTTMVCLDVSG
jgi:outer membrane protein assembly factor BamB